MIILLFAFLFRAHAGTALNLPALLSQPIDKRVESFRALHKEGDILLSQVAFNKKLPLSLRWRAITTMGRMDPAHFRRDLDRALRSPEWFMRNAALIALQTDDRARAVAWSSRLLSDPALVVRTQAVRNLIQLNAHETENLLWKKIFSAENFRDTESLWVRSHMAEALADFATPGHAKQFEKLLLDRDERLYKWAILGLERTTGLKLGDSGVPLEVRRQQWLDRLGVQEI